MAKTLTWFYSKNADGQARLTGYEPGDQSGTGDRLVQDWTTVEDMVCTALADDLSGPVGDERIVDQLIADAIAAPEGDHSFTVPMAD